MEKLDGFDDRELVLEDDGFLTVTRWGDTVERIPFDHLGDTEIVRDDKKKLFGDDIPRIRLRFGAIATAIWLDAAREDEVREFARMVDAARGR